MWPLDHATVVAGEPPGKEPPVAKPPVNARGHANVTEASRALCAAEKALPVARTALLLVCGLCGGAESAAGGDDPVDGDASHGRDP